MERKTLKPLPVARQYKNNGQHLEQIARYNITGRIEKADHTPARNAADCLDIQIKSARATVCTGSVDLEAYLVADKANRYLYVVADGTVGYLMTKTEWYEFATTWMTEDHESGKNGGAVKLRLRHETTALLGWLERAI